MKFRQATIGVVVLFLDSIDNDCHSYSYIG